MDLQHFVKLAKSRNLYRQFIRKLKGRDADGYYKKWLRYEFTRKSDVETQHRMAERYLKELDNIDY